MLGGGGVRVLVDVSEVEGGDDSSVGAGAGGVVVVVVGELGCRQPP